MVDIILDIPYAEDNLIITSVVPIYSADLVVENRWGKYKLQGLEEVG